jgi:hypothetical protein
MSSGGAPCFRPRDAIVSGAASSNKPKAASHKQERPEVVHRPCVLAMMTRSEFRLLIVEKRSLVLL